MHLPRLFQLRYPTVALVLILLLLGLHSLSSREQPSASVMNQQTNAIKITKTGFLPYQLSLRKGEKIRLVVVNQDARPHNFSIEQLHIRSHILQPGESATLIVDDTAAKGVYSYISDPSGTREIGYRGTLIIE